MENRRRQLLAQTETIPRTSQISKLQLRSKQLRLEDVEFVKALGRIDGDTVFIERSIRQFPLKTSVRVPVTQVLALPSKGVAQFILQGLTLNRPALIPVLLENKSLVPAQQELQTILAHADLREKAALALLCFGGMREGTLAKLTYAHIRDDYEAGRIPLHIHIESHLLKGKYVPSCDTFLTAEAVGH